MLMQDLLWDARSFKLKYARPIETGNDKSATAREREVAGCCPSVRMPTEYDWPDPQDMTMRVP